MSTNQSNFFQSSPAIKIRFPSKQTKGYWAIEEQTQKTTFAVPVLATLMTIACALPKKKQDLFDFLLTKVKAGKQVLEKTFDSLIEKKIILPQNYNDETLENIKLWKSSGWNDASDYHFYSWDAPFLDYTKDGKGHDIDRKRMLSFQTLQPDTFRYKSYPHKLSSIPLPNILSSADVDLCQLSVSKRVKFILACVFGKIGEKSCHWSDVPLIRRTSPSGGCRHPSEGYFLPSKSVPIESGFYHIQTDPPSLCLLSSQFNAISEMINPKEIDDPNHLGTIIISTIFERNMYRYREPRTFRTVHMDVGHLLGSIELLSKELGFRTTIHLEFDEESILKAINASKLEECIMALVTLKKDD